MTDLELKELLSLTDPAALRELYDRAYRVKLQYIGPRVSIRGLIEVSNICAKNCFYCGIRRGNRLVKRYRIDADEIVETAVWAYEQKFGSIVMQSGEIESPEFAAFIESVLKRISAATGGGLGVTLSCGEQSPEVYERWRNAGAARYLLRIEASNPELYRRLHPADHDFNARLECLRSLRKLDYQVGSGVMIGLPGQTVDDLVHDLRFFEEFDLDMIGMGPYIPHADTPLGHGIEVTEEYRRRQLEAGLRMIACTRLLLRDVNIASTTALQALGDDGRELGLLAGGNVVMPNITETGYRKGYQLYEGKPSLEESSAESRDNLSRRIASIGETIRWAEPGDSLHYAARHR